MNPRQWTAIAWLRWRLLVNQVRRLTWISRVLSIVFIVICLFTSLSACMGALTIGSWFLPAEVPTWLAFAFDGFVAVFLLVWVWSIAIDLQQSEALTLEKFLHLPASTGSVVLLNYLSSLLSLTLVYSFPPALCISLAIAFRYGAWHWMIPLLLTAFFFMVTAITWQFRGWLAVLMSNQRRKRALIAIGTLMFVVIVMSPSIIERIANIAGSSVKLADSIELVQLQEQLKSGKLDENAYQAELKKLRSAERRNRRERIGEWIVLLNAVVPFGWLPHGVDGVIQNRPLQSAGSLVGMIAIGGLSLLRSYRTAIRVAGGAFSGGSTVKGATGSGSGPDEITGNWLEWEWPILNPVQSAIALQSLRGFSRASEAKLAMSWPLIVLLLFGGSSSSLAKLPTELRPFIAMGMVTFLMMGATQLIQNQFGFDRSGFRLNILTPVSGKDILTGKNAAMYPLALLFGCCALLLIQIFIPLKLSHFAATLIHMTSIFLVASLSGNLLAIFTPLAVKPGSMKPVNLKLGVAMLQVLLFLAMPLGILPLLIPIGIEWLVRDVPGWNQVPFHLIGSITGLAVAVPLYRLVIDWQAEWLFRRRLAILETVTDLQG